MSTRAVISQLAAAAQGSVPWRMVFLRHSRFRCWSRLDPSHFGLGRMHSISGSIWIPLYHHLACSPEHCETAAAMHAGVPVDNQH